MSESNILWNHAFSFILISNHENCKAYVRYVHLASSFMFVSIMLTKSERHVHLRNASLTRSEIMVRCWSSQHDLGYRVLPFDGKYGIDFKLNFWRSTKFECRVHFDVNTRGQFMWYQFSDMCVDCNWNLDEKQACRLGSPPLDSSPTACYNYYWWMYCYTYLFILMFILSVISLDHVRNEVIVRI